MSNSVWCGRVLVDRSSNLTAPCVCARYGAPLNAIDVNGRSPLFTMVATGRAEAAKTLCALDEDMTSLTLADHRGDTPLHATACNGYTDCVLLLLQYGVPANTPINDHMLRALHLALVNEHHETALLLRRCVCGGACV